MKSYLAAAIQMTSVPDLQTNLAQAEEFIDLAVRQGVELLGLPENFSFMGEEKDKLAQASIIAQKTENVSEANGTTVSNYHSGRRLPRSRR